MNDHSSISESEPTDRRDERLADPSRTGGWMAGLVLIVLGVMFLMRNMGSFNFPLQNWWALFILIPAIGAFDSAFRTYRAAGNQFTAPARGSLLVGMVLSFVAVMFLFDISWTFFGPILIILVGLGIIVSAMLR